MTHVGDARAVEHAACTKNYDELAGHYVRLINEKTALKADHAALVAAAKKVEDDAVDYGGPTVILPREAYNRIIDALPKEER